MATVSLSIPPRSQYVGVVRLAISSLARAAGLDEEAVDDLKIAVSEACTNAVESNEEAGSDDPISIEWTDEENLVRVEIGDRRQSVEPSEAGVDTQGFSTRLTMSLALLESLVDHFELSPREGGGMFTRLVLERSPSNAT
ncbi:MAG: hypothetical protein QOH90_372 [Actinomycetota bacterium]|nr:hypothetical protein [Actinomycetota bacterium]